MNTGCIIINFDSFLKKVVPKNKRSNIIMLSRPSDGVIIVKNISFYKFILLRYFDFSLFDFDQNSSRSFDGS